MIRGLYTAAAGLAANERLQEVLANNLANANTPGYKEDQGVLRAFPQELLYRINEPVAGAEGTSSPVLLGSLGTGVNVDETLARLAAGTVVQTSRNTDFAIEEGPEGAADGSRAFFAVGTPAGQAYTRDGQFIQDTTGQLFTSDGYPLLAVDANGTVIPGSKVQMMTDGTMQALDANGQVIPGGKMAAVNVQNPSSLVKEGQNLYRPAPGQQATTEPLQGTVKQGYLEQSNVDLTQTMVNMMQVIRSYEANQKMIQTLDGTLSKAANDIGRV